MWIALVLVIKTILASPCHAAKPKPCVANHQLNRRSFQRGWLQVFVYICYVVVTQHSRVAFGYVFSVLYSGPSEEPFGYLVDAQR